MLGDRLVPCAVLDVAIVVIEAAIRPVDETGRVAACRRASGPSRHLDGWTRRSCLSLGKQILFQRRFFRDHGLAGSSRVAQQTMRARQNDARHAFGLDEVTQAVGEDAPRE
jgi:hypothetical protein